MEEDVGSGRVVNKAGKEVEAMETRRNWEKGLSFYKRWNEKLAPTLTTLIKHRRAPPGSCDGSRHSVCPVESP